MFLRIQPTPMLYLQHKEMDSNYLTPFTSTLRINMNLVSELSMYTIKEEKQRKTLDGKSVVVPVGTNIIHLEMSYTHSTHTHHKGKNTEHTVNERYFYKLVFFPGADAEFLRIKSMINRLTFE